MFSILREFYLGNLSPSEDLKPENPEYKAESKKAVNFEEILLNRLPETDAELYKNIMFHRTSSFSEEVAQAFMDGYTLGALFQLEILERRDKYAQN